MDKPRNELSLFCVQDSDRPLYIPARTYTEAVARWQETIAAENEIPVDEVEKPEGVALICGPDDLLLPDWEGGLI